MSPTRGKEKLTYDNLGPETSLCFCFWSREMFLTQKVNIQIKNFVSTVY